MNETKLIDALIDAVMPDVPPPDPAHTARVKARVLGAPPPRRPVYLIAALATVSVLAVSMIVPRLFAHPDPPRPSDRAVALAAVEAAVERAAQREPTTGRYWRVVLEEARIGLDQHGIVMKELYVHTRWRDSDVIVGPAKGRWPQQTRFMESAPLDPADRKKWESIGAPQFCPYLDRACGPGLVKEGDVLTVPRGPINGYLGLLGPAPAGEPRVTRSRDLPADPEALRAQLVEYWSGRGPQVPLDVDEWLWTVGLELLERAPITPQVQGGLYRMLAGLPGVRISGAGGVLTLSRTSHNDTQEARLIVGPEVVIENYLVTSMDGVETRYRTLRLTIDTAGWTDQGPPSIPPGCTSFNDRDCFN
ncbi:hypothetical protein Aple_017520 [Acrocarpospora pleiomorpha]|uniref:Uncharacterized protein n=1 Tax=Acrocarpospora pleiomorpha TaxID=90975 RepID=A0A5M3XAZ1_9ACTN|nr:hypothetical protein [Acrocarpospora pleiomorpha]GES18857.1 hypothetical protein Aple_017520 [Acrocarpospora pleiomorpha]